MRGFQAPVELKLSTLTLPSPLGRERRILSAFRGALARKGPPSRIFIRGYSFDLNCASVAFQVFLGGQPSKYLVNRFA